MRRPLSSENTVPARNTALVVKPFLVTILQPSTVDLSIVHPPFIHE